MGSIDGRFAETVRRQSVRAVQARRSHLARRPQTRQRGAAVAVHRHSAHHVVRARPDGDAVASNVQTELSAQSRDPGKPTAHVLRVQVRQVQIDIGMPRPVHLGDDCSADDVARRQFRPRVIVEHETMAVSVDQMCAFAAHGFGNQVPAAAGDVQHGRMELHELQVANFGAGTVSDG